MIIYNLANDVSYTFDSNICKHWALAWCYCSDHLLLSSLYTARDRNELQKFYSKLPFKTGKVSINLGDYCTKL
jgi:hypothetical protein